MLACMAGLDTHLTALFTEFADTTRSRAPLYSEMSSLVAEASWCHELMAQASPLQRLPMLWFASLHRICMDHPSDPIADYFPTLRLFPATPRPPSELSQAQIAEFCERHSERLRDLLSTRRTQTNEVGRCALLLPVLAGLEARTTEPLRLLDVGTSAGLTLGIDRYNYRFEPGGEVHSEHPDAPTLVCATTGQPPVPHQMPRILARRGIDANPLNIHDPEDALWLQACVWADQVDRSRTLSAALDTARQQPAEIYQADAVLDLAQHLEEMAGPGHLTVITTWVLNYLNTEQITKFMEILHAFGQRMDVTWLGAEQPDQISPIEVTTDPQSRHLTHVITREWRGGTMTNTTWSTAHPHGYWMNWNPR
jgi:hypothetical protein